MCPESAHLVLARLLAGESVISQQLRRLWMAEERDERGNWAGAAQDRVKRWWELERDIIQKQ